jgi:hypothetical protein
MKWVISAIVLFVFTSGPSNIGAQPNRRRLDRQTRNMIDLTYGGSGLNLSGNYSRKFELNRYYFINASIGAGTMIGIGGITIPHQCTINYGQRFNYLEAGLGGSFWGKARKDQEGLYSYSISPIVGYRRDMINDFVFRVYANPLIRLAGEYFYSDMSVVPYAGISLGYSF